MIFVNSINEEMALTEYLRTKLSNNLKDKAEQIIQCFHSNLSNKSRKLFSEDFFQGNTRIWVCTEVAGLGVNIPNVLRMAQWKLYEYFTFPALIQKIGCTARSICYTGIATVFVESKHVLPKEILEDSDFEGLNSAVALDGEEVAHAIILHLYKSNIQIR